MPPQYGATPAEWAALKRLAKVDLLPVVSNPHAPKASRSKMKKLGKTPSLYLDLPEGRVVGGLTGWTDIMATAPQIETWAKEPDYGICIQTREVRAVDIDLSDVRDADRAEEILCRALGRATGVDRVRIPTRVRASSGRRILAFAVTGLSDGRRGYLRRGSFHAADGLVEFLATGQQFVAAGQHTDGDRYEWREGLPDAWPAFDWQDVKAALQAVCAEMGEVSSWRGFGDASLRGGTLAEDLNLDDPVAEHLAESWNCYETTADKLFIECPWIVGHSGDSGETETAWLLAGTGKYRNGHFRCMHAGCSARSNNEFFAEVGYKPIKASEFEDLTLEDDDLDAAVAAYTAQAHSASVKSKELKAAARLPLPGFNRDTSGKIETSLENLRRALEAYQAAECEIAFDTFRGELMYATAPGAWQSMTDAYQVKLRARFHNLGFKEEPGKDKMRDALEWVGDENQFDSAQVWITEEVPAWDGIPRIRNFFPRYMSTEDTPYTRACGDYLWTALAGRVLEPGCKADMVPVLVGPQGTRKSSGIAAIAPAPEFFSEFDLDARDDDKARKMRGCLVGELAELRGLQTRDRESILAWIARQYEEWTPKYKEHKVQLARRCVFLGSTNDDEFLDDPTGERRWLPMTVLGIVDTRAIARDRLQLWAEAREVFLYDGGVAYEEAERLARDEHHKFKVQDDWLPRVEPWLDQVWGECDGEEITPRNCGRLLANDVLLDCLGLTKITKKDQMRVAGILKKLGMVKVLKKVTTSVKVVTNLGVKPSKKPMKVWVDANG